MILMMLCEGMPARPRLLRFEGAMFSALGMPLLRGREFSVLFSVYQTNHEQNQRGLLFWGCIVVFGVCVVPVA